MTRRTDLGPWKQRRQEWLDRNFVWPHSSRFCCRIVADLYLRSSVETLLSKNFQPARTFVLAFGFDEEVSGTRVITIFLLFQDIPQSTLPRVPANSHRFYWTFMARMRSLLSLTRVVCSALPIVQASMRANIPIGGFTEQHGSIFASPGIAEKGYMDVRVQVNTAGGHSSIPPRHTVNNCPSESRLSSHMNCQTEHWYSFISSRRNREKSI